MKKARFFALIVALFAVVPILQAQDTASNQSAAKKEPPKKTAYRVDFKLYEIEDGKRVNQREYSLVTSAASGHRNAPSSIRIGTRVPVSYEEKKESYINVGLDLSCTLWQEDDKLWGWFDAEISNFALPEQNADPRHGGMPILRTAHQQVETSLTPGKSQVLTTIDDLNTKKRTLIEVVATRID
jgi:hypothetical protein